MNAPDAAPSSFRKYHKRIVRRGEHAYRKYAANPRTAARPAPEAAKLRSAAPVAKGAELEVAGTLPEGATVCEGTAGVVPLA